MSDTVLAANYRYWQDNGRAWPEEYDRRRKIQILYHIQEIMLADYMAHSAPARVLEFGCGFGRHLKYLRQIPGLDVYGYDQSPTMVAEFAGWADPDWVREHVVLGEPVGRLPYPDGFFDIVYTAEVLVHVRPEHLSTILAELLRVVKWQVLHLETAPDYSLVVDVHGGCWYHDLVRAYGQLGHRCEVLPQGYRAHVPYHVILDSSRPVYSGSPTLASLLRGMEDDLQPTLMDLSAQLRIDRSRAEELAEQVSRLNSELMAERSRAVEQEQHVFMLQSALDQQRRAMTDLSTQLVAEQSQAEGLAKQLATERAAMLAQIAELTLRVEQLNQRCQELGELAQAQQSQLAQHSDFIKQLSSVLSGATG